LGKPKFKASQDLRWRKPAPQSRSSFERYQEADQFAQWQYFVDLEEFTWLIFVPLIAWLASETTLTEKQVAFGLLPLSLVSFFLLTFVVHPLEHWQSEAYTTNVDIRPYYECLGQTEFWLGQIFTVLSRTACLGVAGLAIRFWFQTTVAERQAEQLKESMELLRHKVLNNRLQPHFLFNTLNTISALTVTRLEQAREVIGRLGDILRNSIDSMGVQEIEQLTSHDRQMLFVDRSSLDPLHVDLHVDFGVDLFG